MAKERNRKRLIIVIIFILLICGVGVFVVHKSFTSAELPVQKVTASPAEKTVPKVIAKKVEKKGKIQISTLDDIKEQFGKVEVLSLYDGRSFTGAVVDRSDSIVFQTISGKKTFDAKTVRDVKIIR